MAITPKSNKGMSPEVRAVAATGLSGEVVQASQSMGDAGMVRGRGIGPGKRDGLQDDADLAGTASESIEGDPAVATSASVDTSAPMVLAQAAPEVAVTGSSTGGAVVSAPAAAAGAGVGALAAGAVVVGGLALAGGGSSSSPAAPSAPTDTTPPTVAISSAGVGTLNIASGALLYTFTFSEAVTGFDATDVTVTGGAKGTFTAVSATVYTLLVTPTAGVQGNLTVSVAAGVAADAAGNLNTVATPSVRAADLLAPVAPGIALAADTGASASDGITSNGVIDVTGLEVGATWQFSTNAGATFSAAQPAATTSFTLPANVTYAIGDIVVRQTDAAGNPGTSASNASAIAVDTVAPVILSMTAAASQVVLTFDGALDAVNAPAASSFAVTANSVANVVTAVAVVGSVVTLTLTTALVTGDSVGMTYTDPTAGNDANAAQDAAGNDASTTISGIVSDGYVRGAQIYIDTNHNGIADPGELVAGVVTDAKGNFFLPASAPAGSIIAVGGINIDTGVANTMPLKAPAGSTMITPLTTLVQAFIEATPAATITSANTAVLAALGLPAGVNLATFDPVAVLTGSGADATALAVQKAMVQVATIVALAADAPSVGTSAAAAATSVINGLVSAVTTATTTTTTVDLTDTATLDGVLGSSTTATSTSVATATTSIAVATTLDGISSAQSTVLDFIAPAASGAPDLVAGSDAGVSSIDNLTNAATPTLRVSLNTTATDGSAVVAGNTVAVFDGVTQVASAALTAVDVANGYVDIAPQLSGEGAHALSATLTDAAAHVSAASAALNIVLDTVAPTILVQSDAGALKVGSVAHLTFALSEASTGFSASDVVVAGGTLSNFAGSGTAYTADFTPAAGSTSSATVNVAASAFTDAAGNTSTVAAPVSMTVNTIVPTLAITSDESGTANIAGGDVVYTFTFSEDVTGFSAGSVVVSNGAAGLFTAVSGSVYTLAVTPTAGFEGSLGVSVAAGAATSAAGNFTGLASQAVAVVVDTLAPAATSVPDLATASDAGLSSTDNITSVIAPTFVGTGAVGATVTLLDGGVTTLGTATVDVNGAWSITVSALNPLVDGGHSVTATQSDAAGNTSAVSAALAVTIDTQAPAAPTVPDLVLASDHGNSGTDDITNLATPVFSGTAEAFARVTLLEGATVLGTGTADGGGAWNITSSVLASGVHNVIANQTDVAGNGSVASAALAVTIDTLAPSQNGGASFTAVANSTLTIGFSEAVFFSGVGAAVSAVVNPNLGNNFAGTAVAINGGSGTGTVTLTLTTATTLVGTDFVKFRYDASVGNIADLAGNALPSIEISIGGGGINTIDLADYGGTFSQILRGNAGADTLIGTARADTLVDGAGADILIGGKGQDAIFLIEASGFAQDIVKIRLGESVAGSTTADKITNNSSTSGFDISSTTAAQHDVLNLQSSQIAANTVGLVDGTDVGAVAQHSIIGGIITLSDTAGAAILVNSTNVVDASNYIATNIAAAGATVALKFDSNADGTVDSLFVYQASGATPAGETITLPQMQVRIDFGNLVALAAVQLGVADGANVLRLQDTTAPDSFFVATGSDGLDLYFNESTFATSSIAVTMQKNGAGSALAVTSVDNSGTEHLTLHAAGLTLASTDWLLVTYAGTNATNGFSDVVGNVEPAQPAFVQGGNGNNTIDLSALANGGFDIYGHDGDDTIIGSALTDNLVGGRGADLVTGGAGIDTYRFDQGDSPTVVANVGGGVNASILDDGDTFVFAAGADRITDFAAGESIRLAGRFGDITGNRGALKLATAPSDALVTDQGFFVQQGSFNVANGTFTVDGSAGADTLVVYDGNGTTGIVTQTALVLGGVTLAQLQALTGTNSIVHV